MTPKRVLTIDSKQWAIWREGPETMILRRLVGGDVESVRIRLGLTQSQLAKKLKTKQSTVSKYESGLLRVPDEFMTRLHSLTNGHDAGAAEVTE